MSFTSLKAMCPRYEGKPNFPDRLLERRRRAEVRLVTVVAAGYLPGVSTRRMEKLVETLGITRLSRSQVIEMARDLDSQMEDVGPVTFARS